MVGGGVEGVRRSRGRGVVSGGCVVSGGGLEGGGGVVIQKVFRKFPTLLFLPKLKSQPRIKLIF